MSVIENVRPTIRRRECSGTRAQQRRTVAADGRPTNIGRLGRSARSEARARNAVIDAYAMDVASTRALVGSTGEAGSQLC